MKQKCADIRRRLCRRCADLGIPVSGIFELTPRCNLKCKMCYVRLTPEEMKPIGRELTAEEWISFGKECRDAGMVFLLITGGEPTLRKDFCEIYEALAQMGLSIAVNTNGSLLSSELKELWHRLPPSQVNVTLYGVCEEDYENLCANGGVFKDVVNTLDWLESEGILTHINTTITPTNYQKWEALEEFAKNRDKELRMTSYCFPPTRRAKCSLCKEEKIRLDPEVAGDLVVKDIFYREGIESIRLRVRNIEASALQKPCELENGEPMRCMAGASQFWATWYGAITPCGMLDTPRIETSKGFSAAWEELKRFCEEIRLCPDCINCEDRSTCMNCAAVTYAETGRFDGKPQYMCRLSKAVKNNLLRIAEEEKADTKNKSE